jgi:hypothetical protein
MLEEDDGLGFADFLASVQENEKDGIKLSNLNFNYRLKSGGSSNGELWATVNEHWYAIYDGEKLKTNAPVDNRELEYLLEEEFDKHLPHPFIENLQYLNFWCEHDENWGVLITDDYNCKQIQEGDRQGWTLVYNKDKKIVAYMNWQDCGCHVETIDDEFYNFLRAVTKKGAVYAGLDDPKKVKGYGLKSFWKTVEKILKLEQEWVSGKRGKDNVHFFKFSEKETNAWKSEIVNDLSCSTICDERYYKSKDPIGFALRDIKGMASSNPECLYRGKKLTRRLIRELLETAKESIKM